MSYVKIEDLSWDDMPGGSLYSVVELFGAEDAAENPEDPENPLLGPASVEYRMIDGKITATMSTTNWMAQ